MSKDIKFDGKPLSEEDKEYLRSRSRGWEIDEYERRLADEGKLDLPEPEVQPSERNTVAGEFFEGGDGIHVPSPLVDHPVAVAYDSDVPDEDQEVVQDNPALDPSRVSADENEGEEVDIEELHVEDLKDELRSRGESTSGNKAELQDRLREALKKGK